MTPVAGSTDWLPAAVSFTGRLCALPERELLLLSPRPWLAAVSTPLVRPLCHRYDFPLALCIYPLRSTCRPSSSTPYLMGTEMARPEL